MQAQGPAEKDARSRRRARELAYPCPIFRVMLGNMEHFPFKTHVCAKNLPIAHRPIPVRLLPPCSDAGGFLQEVP